MHTTKQFNIIGNNVIMCPYLLPASSYSASRFLKPASRFLIRGPPLPMPRGGELAISDELHSACQCCTRGVIRTFTVLVRVNSILRISICRLCNWTFQHKFSPHFLDHRCAAVTAQNLHHFLPLLPFGSTPALNWFVADDGHLLTTWEMH